MGKVKLLMPFIVLIERRLRPVAVALIAALVVSPPAHAGGHHNYKARKVAIDLEAAVGATDDVREPWVGRRNGQRFVEAVVVADGGDAEMKGLRDAVVRMGGT